MGTTFSQCNFEPKCLKWLVSVNYKCCNWLSMPGNPKMMHRRLFFDTPLLFHRLVVNQKLLQLLSWAYEKNTFYCPQYDTGWVWPWNLIFINLLTISLILVQIWLQQEIFLHSTLSMLLSNAKTQPYTADLTRPIYEAKSYNIRNTNPIFLECQWW